jgi:hypothetical protein
MENNNWCIRLTNENKQVVLGYLNYKHNRNFHGKGNCQYYGEDNGQHDLRVQSWGEELITEQFVAKAKSEGYNIVFDTSINQHILLLNKDGIILESNNTIQGPIPHLDLNITPKQIQSDGGSTQYYQIEITNSKGEKFNCELNDILRDVFNNQWDLCNIVKASRRISEARKGQGKKDVSIKYDANKIIWFAEEIKKYGK